MLLVSELKIPMALSFEKNESTLKQLERALYYEIQYRNAIVSDALTFYDVNLTQDILNTDIFIRGDDGTPIPLMDFLGYSIPCKFSDFFINWIENSTPLKHKATDFPYRNIRNILIDSYNSYKRDFMVEFWTQDIFSDTDIYTSISFLLTKNEYDEICALVIIKDNTASRTREDEIHRRELEYVAYQDPVTLGFNYVIFKKRLVENAKSGSIVSFDIHSFKVINSICGVSKGDEVLQNIHALLKEILNLEGYEKVGHIYADHFVLFFPTTERAVIERKLKSISMALSILSNDLDVPLLQPYYGISTWQPGKKIELAYSEAVAAKNVAKNLTNSNYEFFKESDTLRIVEEKQIVDSFEDAISRNEFVLWFQPKYKPMTKELVGAEALIRWVKQDGSIIQPGKFIPIFEKNGNIRALDEYIFRKVCTQQKKWLDSGKTIVPVSINLSRASLYYAGLVQRYKKIAEQIGIDKKYIPIEITESAAVTNNEIQELADSFYMSGFSLHLDDFGSGYSSLASINSMHFDTLKLDKSLIDYIGNFGGDRLIEHTISLAKELGIHVTAEGVENEDQVVFLNHSGCDSIQGFFYSKPINQQQFEEKLDNLPKKEIGPVPVDLVTHYIGNIRSKYLKSSLYTFIINITQDTFKEGTNNCDWHLETQIPTFNYSEAVDSLAAKFIVEKDREKYLHYMKRENILASYDPEEPTRVFHYSRNIHDRIERFRFMQHLFKIKNSDDIWMFATATIVSED